MLHISRISFPGLGIPEFEVQSTAFTIHIGSFYREIPWYAIIITLGIILCFVYITWRAKAIGLSLDDILDMGIITVISGIVGARLYYVLTTLSRYDSFWDVFKIWEGGLAIYGALIAGGIAVFLCARYMKKIPFLPLADCVCPSLLLAQALGRWGNFTNGEAYGGQTDIFIRMGINNASTGFQTIFVHPTFLYESLWNLLGFALINLFYKKKQYPGQIFYMTFAWYGFGRMFIELLRSDSLYISSHHAWYTKISVLVGFGFFVTMSGLLIYHFVKSKKEQRNGTAH